MILDSVSANPLAWTLSIVYGLFVAVLASHVHEYSHYFFALRQTEELSVEYTYIFARSVEYHQPYDFTLRWCRVMGFAPILVGSLIIIGALALDISNLFIKYIVIFAGCGRLVTSPADWLAILYPDEFIRRSAAGENLGHRPTLKYLWKNLRTRDQA